MKHSKNPELNVGDRIILYHMEGEMGINPGTEGVVTSLERDPFEADNQIVSVKWDNGSSLSILSKYDIWKHAKKKKLDESAEDWFEKNQDILKYFKHKKVREFLMKVRESGITNMFGASPLLYAGREHIDRYYGENPPNEEAFQEVLNMADDVKYMMINGTINYLKDKGEEINEDTVNRTIGKMASRMWGFYANFF